MTEARKAEDTVSLSISELANNLIGQLVFEMPIVGTTDIEVLDDEAARIEKLRHEGKGDELLQELWRFTQTGGMISHTSGETTGTSSYGAYPADSFRVGKREFKIPAWKDENGKYFDELMNHVANLHKK